MQKKRILPIALSLSMLLAATGCGTEMYPLTDREEAIIVEYASHVVTKFNKHQPEGVVQLYYTPEEKAAKEAETEAAEETTAEETVSEDFTGEMNESVNEYGDAAEEQAPVTSLDEALGLNNIEAIWIGTTTGDYFMGEAYSIEPDAGKKYIICTIDLMNVSGAPQTCDILSLVPSVKLVLPDGTKITSETTLLLNDFMTFADTIDAGATAETVLLFQVDRDYEFDPAGLSMLVTYQGTSSTIVQN